MGEKKYIDADAFIAEKRALYCEDCDRRRNTKGQFCYEIGDAPCRACEIDDMLDAVEDYPAADVEEVRHGVWLELEPYSNGIRKFMCSCCNRTILTRPEWDLLLRFPYCHCGAKMDEKEKEK